jgi:hypothetical protein
MSRASSNPKSTDAEARKTPLAFLLRTLFFPFRKCPFAILKVEEDKALCDFVVVIFIVSIVVNSNGVVISL